MLIRNLGREWFSGEAGGGQEPTSSSALGCGPARNPCVLAPSVLPALLGLRKPALNIKHPMFPPPRKKGENSSLTLFDGAQPGESCLQVHWVYEGLQVENGPRGQTNALLLGSQTSEQDPKALGPGSGNLPGSPVATAPGGDSSLHGSRQLWLATGAAGEVTGS